MPWLVVLALKSILSSIIGSSFYNWFQKTKFGIGFQKYVDNTLEDIAVKYDLELAKKDAKFRKQYPLIADRLDALEEDLGTLWTIHTKQIAQKIADEVKAEAKKSNKK